MASAALSPVVMIGGWLAAEALQPPSYSPLRSTISGLAGLGGTDRWIMTSALFAVGACYFATAAGLPGVRVPARIVLVVAGLSSIGIAVSPEPAGGSTPQHLAWTSLGAAAITVWPALTTRRSRSQPLILRTRAAGAVTALFITLLAWLVFETQDGTVLGLAERLVSAVQLTWPFVVALALRHTAGTGERPDEYWAAPDDQETKAAARRPSPAHTSAYQRAARDEALPSPRRTAPRSALSRHAFSPPRRASRPSGIRTRLVTADLLRAPGVRRSEPVLAVSLALPVAGRTCP
jgi:hypothetical membrane protein